MTTYADELRASGSPECNHPDGQLCEHRSAALAYEIIQRGPGVRFDLGALGAYCALTLVLGMILTLIVINVVRWFS